MHRIDKKQYICKKYTLLIIITTVKQASKATKIITRVLLPTMLAILLILFLVSYWVCIQAEGHARYVGMMNLASEKIANTISGAEMNAMNEFDEVEKHLDSPESVIAALESKTSLNPEVRGYFAAFLYFYSDKGLLQMCPWKVRKCRY